MSGNMTCRCTRIHRELNRPFFPIPPCDRYHINNLDGLLMKYPLPHASWYTAGANKKLPAMPGRQGRHACVLTRRLVSLAERGRRGRQQSFSVHAVCTSVLAQVQKGEIGPRGRGGGWVGLGRGWVDEKIEPLFVRCAWESSRLFRRRRGEFHRWGELNASDVRAVGVREEAIFISCVPVTVLFTHMFSARVLKRLRNYSNFHHTLVRVRFVLFCFVEIGYICSPRWSSAFTALRMVGSTYTSTAELDTQIMSMIRAPTFVDFAMHANSPRSLRIVVTVHRTAAGGGGKTQKGAGKGEAKTNTASSHLTQTYRPGNANYRIQKVIIPRKRIWVVPPLPPP